MPDWKQNAISDLREYENVKQSLTAIPEQYKEINARITSIRASGTTSTPIQGGCSAQEDAMINAIDKKERLRINYGVARSKINRMERGLKSLSDNERRVLELFYINRTNDYIDRLCEEMGYEQAQLYRLKDAAVKKFTLSMFGIVDL
ncbi:MAG: DUF1492 domain-containing protein [Oscillospiraceae bacterium]